MFAIRDDRDFIQQEDLNKAVRKLQEASALYLLRSRFQ